MKISLDSAIKFVDGTAIPADELATERYVIFLDMVNPPLQSFPVPAAVVANATPNPDGSIHLIVDAEADLGVKLVPGGTYYIAADDTVDENGVPVVSDETTIIQFKVPTVPQKPEAPRNFSVA